jgi:hypothetical protein
MKKIMLVLLSLLFLMNSITALNSIEEKEKVAGSETEESRIVIAQPLCTGEMNISYDDQSNVYWYYNGDPVTENGGTCNARVRQYSFEAAPDENITFSVPERAVMKIPGLTFPNGLTGVDPGVFWRIGKYIEADFNWNLDTNYCFTETFTTRHKTGGVFPLMHASYDLHDLYIYETIWRYLGNDQWESLDDGGENWIVAENINRPLLAVATDKENYVIPEGEDILRIKLTITDDDLLCGKPSWVVSVAYYEGKEYVSSETFEIRIDGKDLNSVDQNSGAFGVYIIGGNQGELTIDWNSAGYLPGEYDVNITVFDTDGYHQRIGSYEDATVGPFIVEEYGSQIEKIIHVTKEGTICGDTDASGGQPNIADLTYLVDYLFRYGPAPEPLWTANVDGTGGVNIADLTYFVDYLFRYGPALQCAPIE